MADNQEFAGIPFTDPGRAQRILDSLAGQGVTDDIVDEFLPLLLSALSKSPDPDRALNNFERWTQAVTNRLTHFQLLLAHPAALEIFLNVCGTSQFFSDILIRNPEYFEVIANPSARKGKSGPALHGELSLFVDSIQRSDLKLEAMRRFKQREVLRIGARDILGLASMAETALEFSNLADACVQKVYEIGMAGPNESGPALAVIGMGKLGGRELNYSSDIDLMFVVADSTEDGGRKTDSDSPHADPSYVVRPPSTPFSLAEFIVSALSKNMTNGHLFRVDMRLRPEGRFGPLVRTLSSYKAYYESWAEPWERQALLKARFVAGDSRLGEAFMEMIVPFVYQRTVTTEFVESIRANKDRMEKKVQSEGKQESNIKLGTGGIRDIEFPVQLIQLQRGGREPLLRTPNTLDAISRLLHSQIITDECAKELAEDYQFLRTVEHRLQILYELQTQTLPGDPNEMRLLGRRLGFADVESFIAELKRVRERARSNFQNLFVGQSAGREESEPWKHLLSATDAPSSREAATELLRAAGFRDPDRVFQAIRSGLAGTEYGGVDPETASLYTAFLPRLVGACQRSGDPDAAYFAVESLAQAYPNPAQFYRILLEGEDLLERLCRLGAGSPGSIQNLRRHPEWLDLLVSEEVVNPSPKPLEAYLEELRSRLQSARGSFWDTLALFIQRERLRIAARELWGEVGGLRACRELSSLADAVISELVTYFAEVAIGKFTSATPEIDSVAVIGLGKLGAAELSYRSDWDILLVYQGESGFDGVNLFAEVLLAAGQELSVRGAPITLDARLRPEGRFGILARTVEEIREYYRHSALTWEIQTLTRARPVAGDMETARRFMDVIRDCVYGEPHGSDWEDEIRSMKRRIETERLKPGDADSDIKLGHGGISDIEFTVQLYQLRKGNQYPEVRTPHTVPALHSLARIGAIPGPDAARLAEAYSFYTSLRNRLALLGISNTDVLPSDEAKLRTVAIGLLAEQWEPGQSISEAPEEKLRRRFASCMRDTRQIVDRLFYRSK